MTNDEDAPVPARSRRAIPQPAAGMAVLGYAPQDALEQFAVRSAGLAS
jgi:hypothetical protein